MASYRKRQNGEWSVRFRIINAEGAIINKRLSGFIKKCEAERAYSEFIINNKNDMTDQKKLLNKILYSAPTFSEIFEKYLSFLSNRVKPGTIYDLTSIFYKRVIPWFGNIKINKINSLTIYDWQEGLNKDGLSLEYKAKLLRYLSATFKYAKKYYQLQINPCDDVDKFKASACKKEMLIWSELEFEAFMSAVDNPIHQCFFTSLYYSGCRVGELLALTWQDVDWEKHTININKSITRKIVGESFSVTTPKNFSSYRTIKLPNFCIMLLSKQFELYKNLGKYIFHGDRPLPETSYKRMYDKYCEIAKVKRIRIHDFRHSHASLLISNGENIVLIAKRLGHSGIEQTLNTYSHLMPNAEADMISRLEHK